MAATGSDHKKQHLTATVLLMAVLVLLIFPGMQSPVQAAEATGVTEGTISARVPEPPPAFPRTAASLGLGGILGASVAPEAPAMFGAAAADPNPIVVPILFPLEKRINWTDTFGEPRSGGRTHAGNDLLVPKMTKLLAVVDGTVAWLNLTGELSSYNNLPYYNLLLRGADGNDYFYCHLNNDTPGTDDAMGGIGYAYAPGITNGTRVRMGDVLGYVGDSGNAEDTVPHLHFEIHLGGYKAAGAGQTRTPSAINPYASLKAAPTLAEWTAAGKPPLTTPTTAPKPTSTTTTAPKPTPTTTTTAPKPTTPTTLTKAVPGFTDVRTDDWFYADFAQARDAGVVTDAADQRFRPYSDVQRSLFTVYLVRAMAPRELAAFEARAAGDDESPRLIDGPPRFKDVPSTYWAYNEIEVAARLGLVRGTGDGSTFSPENLISRAQMATMMCRALGSDPNEGWAGTTAAAYLVYKDVPKGYWAQGAIFMTHYLGLMCGDAKECFRPEENANRAHAITVVARLLRLSEGR